MATTDDIKKSQTSVIFALKGQLPTNPSSITTLECMSNELLMELFELLDWYSLYFSFSSLNSRLDFVLAYSHNIHVDLDRIPSNKILSHIGRHLPSLDPHRIRSLQSSIKRHTELVLRDDLTVDHFSFIRSLILLKINQKTARLLFENPIYRLRANLVYLYLSFIQPNMWGICLSVYTKLRQCILPNATFCSEMIYLQRNTVQYLQISHEQSGIDQVAIKLLVHSTHLRRLNLHVVQGFADHTNPSSFVRPSSLPSSSLTHLTVQSSILSFSSIDWLLAYAPRLRTLNVRATSSCERMVNPSEWERVLSPELRRFDVRVNTKEPVSLPLEVTKNNDFWRSRKWHIAIVADSPPYLHIYS